ncbi:hypothetical protein JT05_00145 [Desulfosporosinus sp. Tol-M]|nr:hypothetical protein JT05_00145 [Desulfosporosinus sp. Tol-M]
MLNKISSSKSWKYVSVIIILGLLLSLTVQSAFALNAATNKAINVLGYQLLDNTSPTADQLKVYLDKNMSIDGSDYQFTVYDSSNTEIDISNISSASGSGVSSSEFPSPITLPNGCTATLTFESQLTTDTQYTVTVSRVIRANNNLNVGEFLVDSSGNKCDRMFKFKTKNSSNEYTGTPYISEMPWDNTSSNKVPVEGNIGFIVDRPIENNHDSVLSGMTLKEGVDSVVGTDCFPAMCVATHTGFFFPMTYGGTDSSVHNLRYGITYAFGVPQLVDNDSNTRGASTVDFSTTASDIPAKFLYAPTFSSGTLSWTGVTGANHYHIYVDTSKYWGNYSTPDYATTDSSTSISFTPTSGTYVRIEAVDSNGNCNGLSNYLAQ